MTLVSINTVAATVADDVKAFRSAAVTAENKATPFARSMLAALMSGVWTRTLAESAIIHAFGNPKSPKSGKPITKLSGLRDFVGGDAVRKTAETVFELFANIDVADGTVRPLITAFVLGDDGAAKSLRALQSSVRDAIKVHVAANAPDNSEAVDDNTADATDTPATGDTPATKSLNDYVMELIVRYEAASPMEKSEAHTALELLFDTVNTDVLQSADEAFSGEQADEKLAKAA